MLLRRLGSGLVVAGTILVAGCCHTCGTKSCAPPAVISAAPVPPPAPCCPGPAAAAVPAYSSPAPYYYR